MYLARRPGRDIKFKVIFNFHFMLPLMGKREESYEEEQES